MYLFFIGLIHSIKTKFQKNFIYFTIQYKIRNILYLMHLQPQLKIKVHEYLAIKNKKIQILLQVDFENEDNQQICCLQLPQNKFVIALKYSDSQKQIEKYESLMQKQPRLRVRIQHKHRIQKLRKYKSGDKLIIYYLNNEGYVLNTITYQLQLSFSLYPYSSHQIIISATNLNRVTKIQKINLIQQVKIKIITPLFHISQNMSNFQRYCSSQKRYLQERQNIIFFPQSKSFCLLSPPIQKIFDYVKAQFISLPTKKQNVEQRFDTLIQVPAFSQYSFSKGNNSNMLVWFPKKVLTKVICFYFFQFNTQMTEHQRILIIKPVEFQNKQIQIIKIIQILKDKYFIAFKVNMQNILTIYNTQTKNLSFIDNPFTQNFILLRAQICFHSLLRILLMKQKNSQNIISYVNVNTNKIIAYNDELQNEEQPETFKHVYTEYGLKYYNNLMYQAKRNIFRFKIFQNEIYEDPAFALTYLMMQVCNNQTDDDLIYQALNLMSLI